MSRELMLLRHGKSDWSQQLDDFDRPLKDRGKRGAQRMGVWLLQQELVPDLVLSSPAERAITTAQKLVKAMGGDASRILQDRRIYAARVEELLQVLAESGQAHRRLLLVGHNPGLEDLTQFLADKPIPLPSDGKLLPTASLSILELPDSWQGLKAGMGQLLSITRSSSLPKKFPYPDPKGKELRDRPAYYYKQSSVIPYRIQDGKLEILVVMSSKRKHWVVPKGVSDPAISLQESAAKEAFEEAGVEGEVEEAALGSYQYEKWGADCTVQVYPMRVSRILDEETWEESHRGREWLSPKQAVKRLKQAELKLMIEKLAKQLGGKAV
jgi:phosphohistidine phosphatase